MTLAEWLIKKYGQRGIVASGKGIARSRNSSGKMVEVWKGYRAGRNII